jgi:hypothetical protein
MMLLSLRRERTTVATLSSLVAVVALAAVLYYVVPGSSSAYVEVAHTRTYWFLADWRWYEWCGLIAPIFIAGIACLATGHRHQSAVSVLAGCSVLAGSTSFAIAWLFARPHSRTMLIASVQPLRQFHLVYILMILGLGAAFERYVVRRRNWLWIATMASFGGMMFFVQTQTYPHSAHVELPGRNLANGWEQAFLWIHDRVPSDAPVAIDSHYTSDEEEDTQNFQAIAERSSIPDYSKDGGVASITPSLVQEWLHAQSISMGLDHLTDAERKARVRSEAIHWIVLPAPAPTSFTCPYANPTAKVCRID